IEFEADRIRLFPTAAQNKILLEWFGCARWCYNQAVDKFKQFGSSANNITFFRQTIINEGLHKGKETAWVLETPTEVRTEAIRDFQKAVSTNLKKSREDPEFEFEMKFRSVKLP